MGGQAELCRSDVRLAGAGEPDSASAGGVNRAATRVSGALMRRTAFSPNPTANPVGIGRPVIRLSGGFLMDLPLAAGGWPERALGRTTLMNTALPRTCPRCRGSMIVERDWYGAYSTCLCCGYVHEAVSTPPIDLLDEEEGHPRQRRRQPSHGKLRL